MLKHTEFAFTEPCYSPYDGVLFSVYSMGRGYRAFTLSMEAACEKLGARLACRSLRCLRHFPVHAPQLRGGAYEGAIEPGGKQDGPR